ncbi:DUF6497 family protein [Lutimaribacter sp. EGI FJ00015]|uniref:DUF6497 family protein n=1 Tax=Lutimaribacter degradans TaxID=2945989 RepID=A0ACC5ZSM3_9RHOB|nr:DUF6497 family protein [Lutimaribacter sp. EGI FJ00013]MCM2560544.1 DUF6497 family protein [Lutimaribacter sp. EGI FJ00013]MCO0612512.1 DUF6497 family protein [Lutimaribacter sp. EGI FJ00015]MCO0634368.1 DUF6497 family protein [Lutimaribacter sp. EGI FJ00014]
MYRRLMTFVALGGALACATTAAGQEEARPVPSPPSGISLALQDVVIDAPAGMGEVARFRFVAPAIGQDAGFEEVEQDFGFLCRDYALPQLAQAGVSATRVIVSLASEPIEFGATDPEIIQYMDVFRVENDTCIWEGF